MRVGIAGLGKMGSVFADRIKAAGHELAVWNRTPEKAQKVAGATVAASPLTWHRALRSPHHGLRRCGRDGGLRGRRRAAFRRHCGAALRRDEHGAAGHAHQDRQGGGGGARALHRMPGRRLGEGRERGQLLGFAGGDAADVERARPVLDACRRIDHAGPVGAGAALKLAINLPLLVYWQALGEAVSLTDGYGFDPNWLIELFSESSGGPNVLKVRGPNIAKSLAGEDVPLSVDLSTMRKDLGLMLAEAKAKGNASPLVEQVFASFGRAEQAGFAGIDCSAFPAYWARRGNRLSMARIALVTASRDIGGAGAAGARGATKPTRSDGCCRTRRHTWPARCCR